MQGVSRENKLRLLMIYSAINPDKFESDKGTKLMQVIFGSIFIGRHHDLICITSLLNAFSCCSISFGFDANILFLLNVYNAG
jgi:hypothetical protein